MGQSRNDPYLSPKAANVMSASARRRSELYCHSPAMSNIHCPVYGRRSAATSYMFYLISTREICSELVEFIGVCLAI
jgi:hypothetical protein